MTPATALTPAAIAALSGRDLDATIAVTLFNWRWWTSRSWCEARDKPGEKLWGEWMRFIAPPEFDTDVGDHSEYICIADGEEKLYRDWDRGTDDTLPAYSVDWNAMSAVLVQLRLLGWWLAINTLTESEAVRICLTRTAPLKRIELQAETLPVAVCRASLMAVSAGEQP